MVAQKALAADLAVLGLKPAGSKNLSNCKKESVAHSLSLSISHLPDMTKILLTIMKMILKNHNIASHQFIPSARGAPVAQWVKRWPTDLAVPGSIHA